MAARIFTAVFILAVTFSIGWLAGNKPPLAPPQRCYVYETGSLSCDNGTDLPAGTVLPICALPGNPLTCPPGNIPTPEPIPIIP